jgi:hypothetical protein
MSNSGFGTRRAPNVSAYLANLNAIPSAHDIAAQHQQDNFDVSDDLALFTNTQFFDFDMSNRAGAGAEAEDVADYDPEREHQARRENAGGPAKDEVKSLDFMHGKRYYILVPYFDRARSSILRLFLIPFHTLLALHIEV